MRGTQKALMIVGEVISIMLVIIYGIFFFPVVLSYEHGADNTGTFVLMYFFIITMANCVLSIIGRRTSNKAILILNMITSIFSLIFFNGVGAEWGLRAVKRDQQNQTKE